jgi:hypothetical protein
VGAVADREQPKQDDGTAPRSTTAPLAPPEAPPARRFEFPTALTAEVGVTTFTSPDAVRYAVTTSAGETEDGEGGRLRRLLRLHRQLRGA